jgi:hypothetical protein
MAPFPKSRKIRRILLEADALSAALRCAEGRGCRDDVTRRQIRDLLSGHEKSDNPSMLIHSAMSHIAEMPFCATFQPGDTTEQWVFEVIARAWCAWAGDTGRAESLKALKDLPVPTGPLPEGGALHLMAMQPWAQAVHALLEADPVEARRWFRRATELSSQCGTETNSAVQWSYAASYFGK